MQEHTASLGITHEHVVFLLTHSLQKLLLGCAVCDQSVPGEHVAKTQERRKRSPTFWKVSRLVMCVWLLLCIKLVLLCKLFKKMFAAILISYLKCFWTGLMQWHPFRRWDRVCCSSTWITNVFVSSGCRRRIWCPSRRSVPSLLWYSAAKQTWQLELVCRHK